MSTRVQSFRATDVDEARQIFSGIYEEARLEPERTAPFQWTVDLLSSGPVKLTRGQVNVGFSVTAAAVHDRRYILILSGGEATEVETAGQRHAVVSGRSGVVLSPDRPVRIRSAARFQGRNITIPGATLKAHLTALTGSAPAGPIMFDAALDFEARPGAALYSVARLLDREVDQPDASPLFTAGLRDALLTGLLTCVKHSASHLLEPKPPRIAPGSVKRAEEFIEAHAAEPITLADIVAAAGVPARSLRAAFAARHGVSPMEFLRLRRFELARRQLIEAPPGTTVASVAKALALGHAGRFSVEYRKRFGQSPSEALAGGRAGAGLIAFRSDVF